MARLFERVRKGDFIYTYYRPLVKLVIQKASDYDIWTAILNLITTLSRVIPISPASLPPAPNNSTPITNTSASQQGAEQTKRQVDARVFEEIQGCTYRDVQGFYKKYFEGKGWTDRNFPSCLIRHYVGQIVMQHHSCRLTVSAHAQFCPPHLSPVLICQYSFVFHDLKNR
jgi:hypothetical protein